MIETIGSRIAKHRKEKGMTQEELANIMGVSSQAVSKWENDASCPDISLLPKLARELGITTDELLTGKTDVVRMVPVQERKSLDELTLRVRVDSAEGDKIRVNLPMSMVKLCMEIGVEVLPNSGEENTRMFKNVDMGKIVALVEQGMLGKIVEIESAEGDIVEIAVE